MRIKILYALASLGVLLYAGNAITPPAQANRPICNCAGTGDCPGAAGVECSSGCVAEPKTSGICTIP